MRARPDMLSERAHYLSPTGRWCRWLPQARGSQYALFLYDLPSGQPAPRTPQSDGFHLHVNNLHIMRRIS